jgi:hypothetical protein
MDERLSAALAQANYSATLALTRKNLRLKYEAALLYSCNGGTFRITRELINFCTAMAHHGDVVLIDDRDTPIMIRDVSSFLSKISDIYFQATNSYFSDFEKLRKQRTVEALMK